MEFLSFKQKLLGQKAPVTVEYSNEDLAYQISFMIKKARVVKGLTQAELAERIGTKQESIARVESGSRLPSLSFLTKIANAFNAKLIMPMFDFIAKDTDLDFYNLKDQNINKELTIPEGEFLTPSTQMDKFSFNSSQNKQYSNINFRYNSL